MRKIISTIGVLMLLVLFSSFVRLTAHLKTHTVQKFNGNYDDVWNAIVFWFGTNNTPIKNMDKNSGFIATEWDMGAADQSFCDCGTYDDKPVVGYSGYGGKSVITGNFNVIVRKVSDNTTEVTINAHYKGMFL